jgi:alkanesulfonate monooxygenase SsuD/methylene tetrahydromethanopterin reductase-like flavin-dependent oxidoreductase (luciferase family)
MIGPVRSGLAYGAHLPLIDFDGRGWRPGSITSYARAARQLGYGALAVNDHLVFPRPWLDGIVALAGVVEHSGDMQLTTTVLPVVRGPAAVAKAAAALDVLSGGRLVLGVGPGSSGRDYNIAGLPFDERWPRFDEAVRVLRAHLGGAAAPPPAGRFYPTTETLRPVPSRPDGPPIWIASWGSDAGLTRVARLGDGWLASGYNATPARVAGSRAILAAALARDGRRLDGFPCALATVWTYVTDDRRTGEAHLTELAAMLARPADQLADRVLVGPPEQCAAVLRAYADAGIDRVFIWPVADAEDQLARFMQDVAPLV